MRPRHVAYAALVPCLVLLACASPRDVVPQQGRCAQCHGSAANPAPPSSVRGETATTAVQVGAHQLHLRDTPIRSALDCGECHVVPSGAEPPWHFGDAHATVTWGPLASARRAEPGWDRDAQTCSGVYCHGARMRSPPATPPVWTFAIEPAFAPPSPGVCGGCHGYPPLPPHPALSGCAACHPLTVRDDGSIDVDAGHHVNGRLDVRMEGGACDLCHGYPPQDSGHAAHASSAGSPADGAYGSVAILQDRFPGAVPLDAPETYGFGCGQCHPLDANLHMDGELEVELWSASAPAGSLKARSDPAAAFAGGTCGGVYCHSSGQESPRYSATPAWTSGASLGCSGCHDNPPRHASAGAGVAGANSHLVLAGDGFESGHFGGFPSAWHAGTHGAGGGQGASAITCQTCHDATVDPRNTGPSGFYYLDTSGDYRLPGGRLEYACVACHGPGGAAPSGDGRVLPLRHVNGVRDVVFDRRESLPAYAGLPPAPNTPTRPYWKAAAGLGPPYPPGMAFDGTTLSVSLADAGYVPATKTCTSVACHLLQTEVQWGAPQTGDMTTCRQCHAF
jgi:predicted CxxxxCH...CXXCH cytochrome family protein